MQQFSKPSLNRRTFLAALPAGLLAAPAWAATPPSIGEAAEVSGKVVARNRKDIRKLDKGAALMLKDSVETDAGSFARLELAGRTTVHLGSHARLVIDRFVAEAGGVLEIGEGAMVLDRAENLPKIDLTIRSRFGLIAVRGTKFFAGPSKVAFGVFVVRGAVEVTAAGVSRKLKAGDGVDFAAEGQPPGEVKKWKKKRIAAALASAGL